MYNWGKISEIPFAKFSNISLGSFSDTLVLNLDDIALNNNVGHLHKTCVHRYKSANRSPLLRPNSALCMSSAMTHVICKYQYVARSLPIACSSILSFSLSKSMPAQKEA
ncbi:hypothetical protein HAX54_036137 [Datura stramonium]|uniref:Uncharacterized protein n=1 Tax=Datura stramonium TaxID=4076 RepID=A0ABS8VHM6_DATST|nr:hypothetical protein [Datura stramonium]